MSKKILAILLAVVMLAAVSVLGASCNNGGKTGGFKLGVILLHDENSTYDLNFIKGVEAAKKALGLKDDQVIIKRNIPESNECYEAAIDLIDNGCTLIFADSFGHESHLIKAAEEKPEIQFCHATGTSAHVKKLANFHNAFASIYEGRFLAGVAAGMKLNEMIEAGTITAEQAVIGYVGAFTYAEVVSGYTSFFLGARYICPSATMKVQFTGSWYDETAEKSTANSLIDSGCVLISQHADSMGAPSACEDKGVPNVSYNGSTEDHAPNTFIVSSRIDWAPYVEYICRCVMEGKSIDTDWTGTIETGSVVLTDFGKKAPAAGTAEKVAEIKAKLQDGSLHVFDTEKFTVNGEKVTTFKVDETVEVIENGHFAESKVMSAPYFSLEIDGITLLNRDYGD